MGPLIAERVTRIEGREIALLAANEHLAGPCVVFLHGILGSIRFWPPALPPEVLQSVRWYSFGLPCHHPASGPWTEDDLRVDRLARRMLLAIESQVGDAPVSLIGWSTGGFLALALAACYPTRFASVLCISGFARGRWHGLLGALQKLTRRGAAGRLAFGQSLRLLQTTPAGFHAAHRLAAADRAAFDRSPITRRVLRAIYPDFRRHAPSSLCMMMKCLAETDISSRLGAIRCPTTIVGGTRDSIIPFSHTQRIARAIPQARLVAWEGCGHMFFAERAQSFHELVGAWVEGRAEAPQHCPAA
jgi:pimeloyl-ACP methyl ester carboxylesterase